MELVCVLNLSKCSKSASTTLNFTVLKKMPFFSDIHVSLRKKKLYSELCNFSDRKCVGLRPIGKFSDAFVLLSTFFGASGKCHLAPTVNLFF